MPTKKNNTEQNKRKVLKALEKTLGIVTTACKLSDVSRTQFYEWCKEDVDFKREVDNLEGVALDFAESKLLENIKSKKETSIIFYLKTKGKKRGYIEKQEIDYTTTEVPLTKEERAERIKALKAKM